MRKSYVQLAGAAALLLGLLGLSGCASMDITGAKAASRRAPEQTLAIGRTTKVEVQETMGEGDTVSFDNGWEAWVYSDKPGLPMVVSFIPIVGEISDLVEMVGTRRELTIVFDDKGIVRKFKARAAE